MNIPSFLASDDSLFISEDSFVNNEQKIYESNNVITIFNSFDYSSKQTLLSKITTALKTVYIFETRNRLIVVNDSTHFMSIIKDIELITQNILNVKIILFDCYRKEAVSLEFSNIEKLFDIKSPNFSDICRQIEPTLFQMLFHENYIKCKSKDLAKISDCVSNGDIFLTWAYKNQKWSCMDILMYISCFEPSQFCCDFSDDVSFCQIWSKISNYKSRIKVCKLLMIEFNCDSFEELLQFRRNVCCSIIKDDYSGKSKRYSAKAKNITLKNFVSLVKLQDDQLRSQIKLSKKVSYVKLLSC